MSLSLACILVFCVGPWWRPLPLPPAPVSAGDEVSKPSCCDVPARSDTETDPVPSFVGQWNERTKRERIPLGYPLNRHDGERVDLGSLLGRPTVISFAYTRCVNPNKCQRVMRSLSDLADSLDRAGLGDQVGIVVMSYDAWRDSEENMRAFSNRLGLTLDTRTVFLKPDPGNAAQLFHDLGIRASVGKAGVSMHTIQLLVVDDEGGIARRYDTLIWNNEQVLEDVVQLVAERRPIASSKVQR